MRNYRTIFALILLLASANSFADPCAQFLAFGYPAVSKTKVPNQVVLCRLSYVVLYDTDNKIPVYSAEWLLAENLSNIPRVNSFKTDPDLGESLSAKLSDYNGSGYHRGHLTPFEDTSRTAVAAAQSFYLSNIAPQVGPLNVGTWKSIEWHVRNWAKKSKDGLYVITGTVYTNKSKVIGNGVRVPEYFYKVVLDRHTGETCAFLVKNEPTKLKWYSYMTTVTSVEQLSGVSFFPELVKRGADTKSVVGKAFLQ